jgi:hypothetical protein
MKNVAIEERAENVSTGDGAPAIKHQPRSKRWYFDMGLAVI